MGEPSGIPLTKIYEIKFGILVCSLYLYIIIKTHTTMVTTTNTLGKKVKMNLVGLDGNSFSLMGHFQQNGRRQGWTKDEINEVLQKCMSGDYDNLLRVLIDHTEEVEEDEW